MMEQVVELFGRYRSREIGLKELTGTLKNFLLHHPQAPKQGLGWLDLAQQRYPLPVTDFIQLRADMDYMLRSLALQSPAVDADTTRIGMTAPHSRHDHTLLPATTVPPPVAGIDDGLSTRIAAPADDGLSTRIAAPDDDGLATRIAAPADDGLATVIAGVQSVSPTQDNEATVVNAPLADDGATVIAAPAIVRENPTNEATVIAPPLPLTEATVIAPLLPQAPAEATRVATPQAPGRDAPKMPHSQRVPPRTVTAPPPPLPTRNSTPVMAVIGGIALALLVAGGYAGWRHAQTPAASSVTPTKVATTPRLESVLPDESTAMVSTMATSNSTASENTITLKLEIDNAATTVQAAPAASTKPTPEPASRQPVPVQEPMEPLPQDIEGLLITVKSRIEKGRLLPAEDPHSATFAIKALIAKAPESNAVSEARKQLSQAHLGLAKQARERGDLEAAQTHLDNAFDVRLMK